MSKNIIIAIDGPAGSGKSTVAKILAEKLNYIYLDTGAMYRAITYLAMCENSADDIKRVIEITNSVDLNLKFENGVTRVFANGEEVTDFIRSLEVSSKVSEVSRIKEVREALVAKQQQIGSGNSLVTEGRDTTTIVFPNADLKIFLVAAIEARANRRFMELQGKGLSGTLEEVIQNLEKRDEIDSSRAVGPLTKAFDAVVIDTTSLSIQQEVDTILNELEKTNNK